MDDSLSAGSVLALSPQAVVVLDHGGVILAANPAAARRLGTPAPDTLPGRDYFALLPPALARARQARLAALLDAGAAEGGGRVSTVERVPDSNAGVRLVRCIMALMMPPSGDTQAGAPPPPPRVVVYEDDALTLAAAPTGSDAAFVPPVPPTPPSERRLEARFRNAFDQAPHGMALLDTEGRWRRVNRALTLILDRPAEALVGHSTLSATHPDDWAADLGWLDGALSGDETPLDREKRFLRPDGTIVWARVTGALMRDDDGTPREIVSQILDITPKRRMEEALRASESRFRETFDAAAHGMAILDLNSRFREVNPALCTILARREPELLALDMPAVTHPEDHGVDLEAMRRLLSGEARVFSAEKRYVRKGGGVVHAHMALALTRDGKGRPRHVIAHVQDITRQVEAERRMREAVDTAEQALLTKTRFLAAASHDLRQPLQALNLFVSVLAGRIQEPSTRDILTKIERSVGALADLLNTLLDVSRLEAGTILPEPRATDAAALLRRLAEELAPVARQRHLDLRLVMPTATLQTDPHLLEIILRNLIGNAIKYTDPGGRILVGGRRQGRHLRLDVIDTGHGIAADQLALIFQDFHRVSAERASNPGGGLGLGLGIVSRVAHLLGVTVTVASAPGRGSRFSVRVPRATAGDGTRPATAGDGAAPPGVAAEGDAIPRAKPHLVILDDAATVRESLTLLLEGWGFRVSPFANLAELTEALLTDTLTCPDAMLVDFHLPHQRTGVEAVALVRSHFHTPVPALILSGGALTHRLHDVNRGRLPVLQKPVQPDHLRVKLTDLLRVRPENGPPP
ncbi:PAS domain S-box protein [Roseospira visakhapatnamensis]|uniref:histidine kinase n=1 Tax=Roseospira visakhapatnamensis TaxID=390880 RepID=A0A7W6W9Q3_9PROT|nr:PAS domain S-box protein [Roseospira visakhapatnamensis]MBB4266149.1 PAS domain S-box-containing protein [Roseospira visakhapatnamensis]